MRKKIISDWQGRGKRGIFVLTRTYERVRLILLALKLVECQTNGKIYLYGGHVI